MASPRVAGICYAIADDGLELPVIDVTHPAFAVQTSADDLAARTARFAEESRARSQQPPEMQAAILKALRASRLGAGLQQAAGGFVNGITTYVIKLGPDHLGSFANEIDKRIAASFPAWTARLRLQTVAQLVAGGLAGSLRDHPHRALTLVDIAGGPAADAINALLLLRSADPALLTGRTITIRVLDADTGGPSFGARAVAALTSSGGPLDGLVVRFDHQLYDWNETVSLERLLEQTRATNDLVVVSSEGGLFEYGTDDAIVHNLNAVGNHAPADVIVVGSVTREDGIAAQTRGLTGLAIVPRSSSQFAALAAAAGWRIDTTIDEPFSRQVRLLRAAH